jgi:hypothetical protein
VSVEQHAYEHVIEKLRNQNAYLATLRNQAAIASAVAGLIATVFATLSGQERMLANLNSEIGVLGVSFPALLLFLCFGGSLACSALVLIGWRDFTFAFNTIVMLNRKPDYPNIEEFYCKYVRDGEYYFGENEKGIQNAQNMLWFSMVLGWAQIVPWIIVLVGSPNV